MWMKQSLKAWTYTRCLFTWQKKNKAIRERVADPELVVLTADTVVILDGKIIGKPLDAADACRMLGLLQGRMHEVVTGVCISGGNRREFFSDTTRVYFNSLSREEISYYVDHFQPFDKAGSYAIQEWIGYVGVARIEGCFYNVMGLPIPRVYPLLRDWQP